MKKKKKKLKFGGLFHSWSDGTYRLTVWNYKCCTSCETKNPNKLCVASISIFLIDKFKWASVVGLLWVTNQTTGLYKHPQWWYCHSSPIRSSKLNNSWRPVPSQGFLLLFDVCSLKKKQTSKHLSAHTTAATCVFDVPVCEAACRTFREQKKGDEFYRSSRGECARMQMDCQLW